MPWNGSAPNQTAGRTDGTRTGDDVYAQQAAAPVDIEPTLMDIHDTDLKDMINACLKKDGGNTASADIPMGGFTLTNISVAGARTEPASFADVQDNKAQYVATVGGTADAITLTPAIAITAYVAGQRFSFIAGGDNTGATTVNVSGVGAKSITLNDGSATALSGGEIVENAIVDIEYDGTQFLLMGVTNSLGSLTVTGGGITSRGGGTQEEFVGERYAADALGVDILVNKSRNSTVGSHTIVQSGDLLGQVVFQGSDGTDFEPAGAIQAVVDGTPGAGDMPGTLVFSTTADGAEAVTERMAIRADGRVQIPNRSAPLITLHPNGELDLAEISTPAAPASNVLRTFALDVGGATKLAVEDSAGLVAVLGPGELIAIIEDRQTINTAAQTINTSATVRNLNTLAFNRNSLVSLSSNRFTLPAGTWEIEWSAPMGILQGGNNNSNRHQSFLFNQTDSTEVARGTQGLTTSDDRGTTTFPPSTGRAVVTITASKAFEIRHIAGGTGWAGGDPGNLGTEVYARVVVRRA